MLKSEVQFQQNSFGTASILSLSETVSQLILNILFMKPGQLPSLPHVGMNISQYFTYQVSLDEIDITGIKNKIQSQCSSLSHYIDLPGIQLSNVKDSLVFVMPLIISNENETLLIGVKQKSTGDIVYNYTIDKNLFSTE